jgi:CheY-like chemotaxis protein
LIFTDLSMPGSMDGLEFAAAIRMRFPDLPVILTTGHVGVLSGRRLPNGVRFVRKPHSRTGIAAAVRQALAGDQAAVLPGLPSAQPDRLLGGSRQHGRARRH